MNAEFVTRSPEETAQVAARLSSQVHPGLTIGLVGELGAGKTVWVRGFVAGLGGDATDVRSPTFTLMNVYPCGGLNGSLTVNHFDVYRLSTLQDLEGIGFSEFAESDGVTVVEWPDRIPGLCAELDWVIEFRSDTPDGERTLTLTSRAGRP